MATGQVTEGAKRGTADAQTMELIDVDENEDPEALGDEWKQAQTPGGRTYFYNRRTRQSSWQLPSGMVTRGARMFAVPTEVDCTPGRGPSSGATAAVSLEARAQPQSQPQKPFTVASPASTAEAPQHRTPKSIDPQARQRDLKKREHQGSTYTRTHFAVLSK